MFLGTPEFATVVLGGLLGAAKQPGSGFQVCSVVTHLGYQKQAKPGAAPQRFPMAMERFALSSGVPSGDIVFTETGAEAAFLARVRQLSPDLCVTVGYAPALTADFLAIPPLGTVDLHASLLPRYRGAFPVERALVAGDLEVGISLAFAVQQADAGPVLQQAKVTVEAGEAGKQLHSRLMQLGSQMLLQNLPDLLAGQALAKAVSQDESTLADAEHSLDFKWIDFAKSTAQVAHSRVCALSGQPVGRTAVAGFVLKRKLTPAKAPTQGGTGPGATLSYTRLNIRVLRSRVVLAAEAAPLLLRLPEGSSQEGVLFLDGRVLVSCQGGDFLELLQVTLGKLVVVEGLAQHLGMDDRATLLPSGAAAAAKPRDWSFIHRKQKAKKKVATAAAIAAGQGAPVAAAAAATGVRTGGGGQQLKTATAGVAAR